MWAAVSGEFLQTATDCPFFLYLEGHWAVWRPCETRCTHFVLPDVNGAASQGNCLQGIAGQYVPEARIRLDNGGELVLGNDDGLRNGGGHRPPAIRGRLNSKHPFISRTPHQCRLSRWAPMPSRCCPADLTATAQER